MKLVERHTCPVCHSSRSETLYKEPYNNVGIRQYLLSFYTEQGDPDVNLLENEVFQLEECSDCKLIYQKFIPDNYSLFLLYTKWISFTKAFEKYERFRPINKLDANYTMLRDVCQYLNSRDLKCFDYGFGHAHLLKQAQIFGMDLYGSELNPIQIEYAKQYGIKIINFTKSEPPPKMDIIFCEQVLEHTADPRSVMDDIVKISKRGTLLHLSVPDSANVNKTLKSIDWLTADGDRSRIMPFSPLEHINSFKYDNLLRLAQSYGFRRIDISSSSVILGFTYEPLKFLKYVAHYLKIYLKKTKYKYTTDIYFIYDR